MTFRPNIRHLAVITSVAAIGAMCYLAASFDTFPGDKGALTRLQSFRSGWLDDAAVGASAFSQTIAVFVSVPTISLALWLVRMKANAVAVILVLVPDGLNMALKWIVDRPRPDFSLVNPVPEGSSFPSGHSVHAFLLFGLLLWIVGELVESRVLRISIQGLLGIMILACGASRVYLGVHWPSDVIGGFVVGGFSLVAIMSIRRKLVHRGLQ